MVQLQLHRIWRFADHRPAVAVSVLSAILAIQSVVAYGQHIL
ncbi:hypothetical protein [Sphingomonas sp. PAMC 26621]|nr:hypothetical protein [Sphingomonas sp. PAMC 26621]